MAVTAKLTSPADTSDFQGHVRAAADAAKRLNRASREALRALAELRTFCDAHGINFEVDLEPMEKRHG